MKEWSVRGGGKKKSEGRQKNGEVKLRNREREGAKAANERSGRTAAEEQLQLGASLALRSHQWRWDPAVVGSYAVVGQRY